ncbi:hypothetical protein SCP_0510240 [Sparassis crispa]|uniref:Uncharacterized protein n=1 Tax=Sparassis crispa TaxID=139825 RepID=A0A401GP14_9APHY|nr:hypothetical protein SCP_0510240 [Sparassis crispa]GBE83965.1 hypothetical protein SCP_0510240 [Sparassis crispa]
MSLTSSVAATPSASSSTSSPSSSHTNFYGFPLIILVVAVGLFAGVVLAMIALRRLHPRRLSMKEVDYVVIPELWEYVSIPDWADREGGRWADLFPLSASFFPDDPAEPVQYRSQKIQRSSRNPLAHLVQRLSRAHQTLITMMYGPDMRVQVGRPQQRASAKESKEARRGKLQVAVTIAMPGSGLFHADSITKTKDPTNAPEHMAEYCLGLTEIPWHVKHQI